MLRPFFSSSNASRLALFGSFALLACSEKSSTIPFDSGTGGGAVTPDNISWCPAAPPTSACNAVSVCGVCVPNPPGDLKRTTDTREFKGTGDPDLSCLKKGATLKSLNPGTVKITMKGYAKIFANGPDSANVKIEVFKEGANGATDGAAIASTITDKTLPIGVKTETIYKAGKPQDRTLYPYEIKVDAFPVDMPLIVKTSGKAPEDGWFNLYDYGVIAYRTEVEASATFNFDVRALGNDDYASILKAAYSRPPEGGKAAIAGEVHDCQRDDPSVPLEQREVRLANATVEIAPRSSAGLFYLSEVEDDPLPDPSRKGTGRLGLYAVGALSPGPYTVAASGKIGTTTYGLGSYTVQAFPDSVSVFTFRGRRPWQK